MAWKALHHWGLRCRRRRNGGAFKASTGPTAFSRLHGFDLAIISLLDVVFVVLWPLLVVVVVAISLPLGALPQLMRTFVEMTKKPPEA